MMKASAVGLIVLVLLFTMVAMMYGKSDQADAETIALQSTVTVGSIRTEVSAGFERVAATDQLALDFNPDTAVIHVRDQTSGAVWSSNPEDLDEDHIARGAKKLNLQSQLLLDYVDPQYKPFQLNNFTGSIKDKRFTWEKVDGGILVRFEFPKVGFVIPVRYSLEEDGFSAAIVTEDIEQNDKYKLVNMYLLPFFGAGNMQDEGYMFVPDGSGALVRFNNNKQSYTSYNERVYGADESITKLNTRSNQQYIKLPVFGLKRNNHAFVAIIHQGAYQAGVIAEVSQKNNEYNTVYSYMNVMESETNLLMEGTASEKQIQRMSETLIGGSPYEVKYYFLSDDQANYVGMAGRYRQYLIEDQGVHASNTFQKEQVPLLIDFLGGVKKRKTLLGIPYRTVEPLTTFKDVSEAVNTLQNNGLNNLAIRYEGWMKGGMKDQVTVSVKPESNLGGAKGFTTLVDDMKTKDIAFYPVVDPIYYYKGGNGFYKFFDVVKGISRAPVIKYDLRLSDGTKNRDISPWFLLNPEAVKQSLERYSTAANKYGLERSALQHIGSTVYTHFRKDSLARDEVGQIWEQTLNTAKENLSGLMFERAGAYTFTNAESLSSVPLYSSQFDSTDEAVPFYSIVISGLIPGFSEPINLSSDPSHYMLKLMESGTYPAYRFIAQDGSALIGTEYDSLYSANFDVWIEEVISQYEQINDALAQVLGQEIIGHEQLQDDVYRTSFANGKSILVNYSNVTALINEARIEANSYLIQ